MDEECAICAGASEDGAPTMVELPGCGHRFHLACVLTCAQYDVRCPMCRRVPDGVRVRDAAKDAEEGGGGGRGVVRVLDLSPPPPLLVSPSLPHAHPRLYRLRTSLARISREVARENARVVDIFARRCRDVWNNDVRVLRHRTLVDELQRRELRVRRVLDLELRQLVHGGA